MDAINFWRGKLKECLAPEMSNRQIQAILLQYDNNLAGRDSSEGILVFRQLCESYANLDTDGYIKQQLERINKHSLIVSDPIERTRAAIKKFNKNISAMDIEVTGIKESDLMEHQREAIKKAKAAHVKIEEIKTFSSVASKAGQPILSLTVKL
jgi:hypothetical protein